MKLQQKLLLTLAAGTLAFQAAADGGHHGHAKQYTVTITNLTNGISFTPFLAATHDKRVKLFTLGEAASDNISRIAEGGDTSGLNTELMASSNVYETAGGEGLLGPGESVSIDINGNGRFKQLSLISMLLPTNDTLAAMRGKRLPNHGSKTYFLRAYDGGTETNDELCAHIPGPHCGGEPFSPDDAGEGYIYPSPGIHGEGDLSRMDYQWDGPVAKVVVERTR